VTPPRTLLLTVGTGNVEDLDRTLLTPLRLSIARGEWSQVILLPSQLTAGNAEKVRALVGPVPIVIEPLPAAGQEDDADACFAHFHLILERLLTGGARPADVLVDFTRGTKAMSAALVLAAVGHGLPQLRYIYGGERDERGQVKPGTERVGEFATAAVTAVRRLEDAQGLVALGHFASVQTVLAGAPWPADLRGRAEGLARLAEFYAAWDRLDYAGAHALASAAAAADPAWARFLPPSEARAWVAELAQPLPDDFGLRAARLRRLAADLTANGERRIRDHQFEDAMLRAYRVLELVGQLRLFARGHDPGNLDPNHAEVKQALHKLIRGVPRGGTVQLGRFQVAALLKELGDGFGRRLIELGNLVSGRNDSVLIHGYMAVGGRDADRLRDLFRKVAKLVREDGGPAAEEALRWARWPDFTRGA
jgi:CRISPR-associated protein (TIGR02710 family)